MFAGQLAGQLFYCLMHLFLIGERQLVQIRLQRGFQEHALAGGIHVQPILGIDVGANLLAEVVPQVAQQRLGFAAAATATAAGQVGI